MTPSREDGQEDEAIRWFDVGEYDNYDYRMGRILLAAFRRERELRVAAEAVVEMAKSGPWSDYSFDEDCKCLLCESIRAYDKSKESA